MNVFATALTGADGRYAFTGLGAGSYIVEFVKPVGLAFAAQNLGSDDSIDSDANIFTGLTDPVILAAGDQVHRTPTPASTARPSSR